MARNIFDPMRTSITYPPGNDPEAVEAGLGKVYGGIFFSIQGTDFIRDKITAGKTLQLLVCYEGWSSVADRLGTVLK